MPISFDIDLSNDLIYFLPSKNVQRFFFFQRLKSQKYRRIERVKRAENSKNSSLETN